jgi:hypothetical protein
MSQTTAAALAACIPNLGTRDRSFASDLCKQWNSRGRLSLKQLYWVDVLIQRATNPTAAPAAPEREKVSVGSFAGVMQLFATAKQHLKYPKITLQVGDQPLQLSLCGAASKTPGQVNVSDGGRFGHNVWYGRVSQDGVFEKSDRARANPAIERFLEEFSQAPAAVAKKYGRLTGRCCFCNTALTDERSTAAGFGPVCADHFGLKAEWKAAVAVLDVADDELAMQRMEAEGDRAQTAREEAAKFAWKQTAAAV